MSRSAEVVASGRHPRRAGMGRWLSKVAVGALLLAMAGQAVAAESSYRSTRAKPRPSVSASCSGFTMLQPYDAPGAARAERRAQKAPAWRREGLRQHLRYYRTACPDGRSDTAEAAGG